MIWSGYLCSLKQLSTLTVSSVLKKNQHDQNTMTVCKYDACRTTSYLLHITHFNFTLRFIISLLSTYREEMKCVMAERQRCIPKTLVHDRAQISSIRLWGVIKGSECAGTREGFGSRLKTGHSSVHPSTLFMNRCVVHACSHSPCCMQSLCL